MDRGRWRRSIALALVLTAVPGCSEPGSIPDLDLDLDQLVSRGKSGPVRAGAEQPEHDFGPVLAGKKVLRHEFTLSNPTDRPVRLLSAEARTPCCSTIGPLPESISPGGQVKVPVALRTGYETGIRRVEFVIVTDAPSRPVWSLAVRASFFSEFEVEPEGDTVLTAGKPGEITLHLIGRRHDQDGLPAPDEVEVRPPLEAVRIGPITEHADGRFDGMLESTRDVTIRLPSVATPGPQRQEIALRWKDGLTKPFGVGWTVVAPIRASPAGIVLRSAGGAVPREVVLETTDRPFRILDVSGPLLAARPELSADARQRHEVNLEIDPRLASGGGARDIHIATDHPDQPDVAISILVSTGE